MKFEVLKKWGVYSKGDILEMHPTTGNACKGFVKPYKQKKETPKK